MATLGMKLDGIPTEEIVGLAPEVEAAGLEELWVCEDLGRNGGIAQAALALAATRQIRVGLGILPAAVRNVAYMAMEIASLSRAHPGRFVPGIGHGMPSWLRQVDAHPGKLLPALEEVTVVARRLVRGETVTFHGEFVQIDDVKFQFPAPEPPPFLWGVRGPNGIQRASRSADGLVLAEGSGPGYVRRAREKLADPDALIVVFAWFAVDRDHARAVDALRATVDEALEQDFMQAQISAADVTAIGERLLEELTVSGDAESCARSIERLWDAGADSVVLQPVPGRERDQLRQIGSVLGALRRT
jgi:5,10-methylenetetrahydromethanopterin reductase